VQKMRIAPPDFSDSKNFVNVRETDFCTVFKCSSLYRCYYHTAAALSTQHHPSLSNDG